MTSWSWVGHALTHARTHTRKRTHTNTHTLAQKYTQLAAEQAVTWGQCSLRHTVSWESLKRVRRSSPKSRTTVRGGGVCERRGEKCKECHWQCTKCKTNFTECSLQQQQRRQQAASGDKCATARRVMQSPTCNLATCSCLDNCPIACGPSLKRNLSYVTLCRSLSLSAWLCAAFSLEINCILYVRITCLMCLWQHFLPLSLCLSLRPSAT